uniref:NADH dehydrogenase subunit 11 n=1 Tax=Trachydiscus minutus TaxID=1032745 RepID=A0A140F2R4_9STRA|nr:NADH dehydrogenase subunit 11 [Trachydiscus minutus]AML60698.1 NADH dehydrogenase subunit 11 [Trachydiscus minutus]
MLLYTGALTSKPYAFTARPWELRSVQSVDILDGMGSNIRVDFKETEILRILPRRNLEINESWISDKARFFYDGLKRQRLNSPYMKINGELKKVKWSKILKNLTSVLKVYSFEFGHSKIGVLCGASCDTETFFTVRDLALSFGFSNLGIDRELKVATDEPSSYLFKGEFKDLEKTDFCLFVGTNPRFEASTLNLRLRKLFRRGNFTASSIGGHFSTTFPVQSLGLTSKTLLDFVEGRHPSCKLFSKAKNPVILYGSHLLERVDSRGIQSLFGSLSASLLTLFGKSVFVNPLHTDSNVVGAFELGYGTLKIDAINGLKVLYGVGLENKNILKRIGKAEKENRSVLVIQDSHGSTVTTKADFVLPVTTFVEKNSIYYNMEGRPQKTQRALVGPNLSRDDWRIFRVLFSSLKKSTSYITQAQLVTEASKILPSLYFANSWFLHRESSIAHLSLFVPFKKEKVLFSYLKLPIEDFYMTHRLCQSSRIMAKASQYLRSYFHNYKFLVKSN